jgi:hypothetical protein
LGLRDDFSCKNFIIPYYDIFLNKRQKEIITGEVPFKKKYPRNEPLMIAIAVRKELPEQPEGISELPSAMWTLWEQCWNTNPSARPTMEEILTLMTEIARDHRPLRLLSLG